ncbi:MAG: T9SS type A sorting domain-containing protein [Bacteroidetes bacterium]|nr:T9SS type A sorting domain-containing protein [Bacteroidota bacterium]
MSVPSSQLIISPNPILSSIKLNLIHPDDINISLFDVQGRLLRIFSCGRLDFGINKINLDRNDLLLLSNGIYILHVQGKFTNISSKILLMKN